MKIAKTIALSLALTLALCLPAHTLWAQEDSATPDSTTVGEKPLAFADYKVKAYTLTGFFGNFSGGTYLENPQLGERTVETPGAGDILGFDGNVLPQSQDPLHYDAAHKDIESGPAYGGRVGIYVARDFHLDLAGTIATGKAVTTMLFKPQNSDPSGYHRIVVDQDDGYSLIKGGVHLGYDANPATFFGLTPKLGFGIGGLINRYTTIEDKTALYLEGNLGLKTNLAKNLSLTGQVDLTTFAYKVDELGYSNIVKYTTFTVGLTWFLDVVPSDVRAAHLAELKAAEE